MTLKRMRFAVVPVALLFLLALWWWRNADSSSAVLEFSGNLEATEIDIAFKTSGRIVELLADEGDPVEAGRLLARLDDDQLQAQRREVLAQLEALRSREGELRALIRFQEENLAAQMKLRQAELRQAEALLDQLREGSRRQEIEQARAAVEAAQAEEARARADWERAQTLYAAEDISAAQRDQAESAWKRARAELSRLQEQLALVQEGPRRQDIEAAQAGVARAEAALRQTSAQELEIARNRQALQTLAAEAETLQARLAQVESRIADCRIEAPMAGIVLKRPAEPGEIVAAGTPVMTLGDLSRPWVRGYVPETRLGQVKLGDRVEIRTDSYPDRIYEGRVVFISDEAEFTPKQIETREERVKLVYRIKVLVANPHQELKLNMPVDARIALNGGALTGPRTIERDSGE